MSEEDSNNERLEKFENEIMPPLLHELERRQAELRFQPITVFGELVNTLAKKAFTDFLGLYNTSSVANISKSDQSLFLGYLVSGLNSTLPLDYPYIVIVLEIGERGGLRIGVFMRQKIPGLHDLLAPNIFPLVKLKTAGDVQRLQRGELSLHVKFLNQDDMF